MLDYVEFRAKNSAAISLFGCLLLAMDRDDVIKPPVITIFPY